MAEGGKNTTATNGMEAETPEKLEEKLIEENVDHLQQFLDALKKRQQADTTFSPKIQEKLRGLKKK
jgi:1-acyl-sn-glycerol-3-phosphate acyltransferase